MEIPHDFRASRWVIALFGLLGVALVILAVVFALVAKDKLWALVCVCLPTGLTGLWLLTRVPPLLRTRIVLDESGITLQIPVWAGGWLRRGRLVRLRWSEIARLTHAQRLYYPMMLPLVVDEYRLYTTQGDFTITKNICPRPQQVMALVAARTGKPVEDLGLER
ncbi:hypothetical protein [uncultured Thiodictyon sp.]|jgi:hypothetical protein|uniref:hypothetical protein n=1 Tax=uncultured Thiodictyon sp. TaxID=1846217 RepID=UPI0025F0718E|nr:hypothetical protein [uncultured Thiodictyon sp.]